MLSLESQRPVRDFDVLAFSLCFENDYPGVLTSSSWPAWSPWPGAGPRPTPWCWGAGWPPCSTPSRWPPSATSSGSARPRRGWPSCSARLAEARLARPKPQPKAELLAELARDVPGVYVPSLYGPEYAPDGRLAAFEPLEGAPERVRGRRLSRLEEAPARSVILTPEAELGDMYLIEVARGCGRGCRFCAAGYVYRPPRQLPREAALGAVSQLEPGMRCGLVGAAVSDYPHAAEVGRAVLERGGTVSVSSLRADSL